MIGDARGSWLPADALALLQAADAQRRRPADALSIPLDVGKLTLVKESEKRKLRADLRAAFSPALDADDALDALVPCGKAFPLARARLGATRHEVFCVAGEAVVIAADRKTHKTLVPTVLGAQRCPHVLRQLAIHAPVRTNVLRGADLFAGGVVGAQAAEGNGWPARLFGGPFERGELVALVSHGDGANGWAPYAVGHFARSSGDTEEAGLRGVAVAVLSRVGDALWPERFGDDASADAAMAPPPAAVDAATAAAAADAEAAAHARRAGAARAAAQKVADAEAARASLARDRRRLEKALRQIADLRGRAALDAAQADKVRREPALVDELAAVEAALAALDAEDAAAEEAEGGAAEDAGDVAAAEAAAAEDDDATAEGDDAEEDDEAGEATAEDDEDAAAGDDAGDDDGAAGDGDDGDDAAPPPTPDELFLSGFLTTLKRDAKPPVLVAEAVGAAAKLCGVPVKSTSWKKAGAFVASLADCLDTKERSKGVLEISRVDWRRAPPFRAVDRAPAGGDGGESHLRATKKGSQVTVACRRVRDKNCTFVDGLDSWGYDERKMKELAAVFRAKFSAAASVAPRKGTEDNKQGRKFFSIMVQGKYLEQIARALREDYGVANVATQAKKGLVTKKDRKAFANS